MITEKEVVAALERGAVGDVKPLGEACLDLLKVVKKLDPKLIKEAEKEFALNEIAALEGVVAKRLHLEHDDLRVQLEELKARVEGGSK